MSSDIVTKGETFSQLGLPSFLVHLRALGRVALQHRRLSRSTSPGPACTASLAVDFAAFQLVQVAEAEVSASVLQGS